MPKRPIDIDLFRSVQRGLHIAKDRSSFPLISGDTYAALCDFKFGPNYPLASLNGEKRPFKLFLPAIFKEDFLRELKENENDFSKNTLVIHNYDNIPSRSEMATISKRFRRVYSVNWLGDRGIATPIPIGLENWSILRNGVPGDFQKVIAKGLTPALERSVKILSSFSIQTNLDERSKALEFARNSKDVLQMPAFTSPAKYRDLVANSRFLLSPPGNGVDCHRTWEAIYLGAIPIVLKKFWPFQHLDLPVLIVNDWFEIPQVISSLGELPTKSIDELQSMFLTLD
jgi:hypothetical protein